MHPGDMVGGGVDDAPDSCQNCGKLIFDDMKGFDDACSAPYVTESGDLYCIPCGRRHDEAQRQQDEEDAIDWMDDPYEAAGESPFGLPGGGKSL
jgi:hypothetical protein